MDDSKIYVAGHLGMAGSAIMRNLKIQHKNNLIYRSHQELDLTDQSAVQNFFKIEKPDQVYIAAAKTGGIFASTNYPAEFIYTNLMIEANIIHSAFLNGVKKILFLGSSCSYPKNVKQPMLETALLTGSLDYTNEPYSIAKIAGIKICESYNRQYGKSHGIDYRSVMPTSLYGPGDNYDLKNSHVIPALIRRFHEAKIKNEPKVVLWGSGEPRREFLHVDDMARACIKVMEVDHNTYNNNTYETCSHINVGTGIDITIKGLAEKIKKIIEYTGTIEFDTNKPDGVARKLIDNQRIKKLGWSPLVNLEDGLLKTYQDFKKL
ncbi:GDP-L-fucose synthase family protein [Candidatus Pelagibacter bacterium nBUS_29]|uniref:GDP-L-fucose synthase family protein n=1 Tax=Candidatus Pelagibacter bacterium nBUS_29 TaxID=3374190 RepID=UPI003EBA80A8